MDIRTFEARSMKEALARVRSELGPEAVILQSREIKRRRLLGLVRAHSIEITAGTGLSIAQQTPSANEAAKHQTSLEMMHQQLQTLSGLVEDLCRRKKSPTPDLPVELIAVYTRLIDADVHEAIASGFVCRLRDEMARAEFTQPQLIRTRLAELVSGSLSVSGPIVCESGKCKVVALVGPTGVGKTASVAKLAANFKLRQNLRVGLVSVDTYRIAAVEQLRTYAEIIDIPIKIASSPREMATAVSELNNLDLVLIDTTGRSPRDEMRIKELRTYLKEAGTSEVHLVLSAGTSSASLMAAIEPFSGLWTSRLLFTKLDEASALGGLLSCVVQTGHQVSYLTTGQDVPDNIEVADAEELAERIVGSVMLEPTTTRRRAA